MNNITIPSKSIKDKTGELIVIQDKLEQFNLKRLFFVHADKKCIRGGHAHIECQQFLICIKGEIKIFFDSGYKRSSKVIKKNSDGVLIPKGIWSEQMYTKGSILLVLCDQKYEENDYIRDYDKYLKWKNIKK